MVKHAKRRMAVFLRHMVRHHRIHRNHMKPCFLIVTRGGWTFSFSASVCTSIFVINPPIQSGYRPVQAPRVGRSLPTIQRWTKHRGAKHGVRIHRATAGHREDSRFPRFQPPEASLRIMTPCTLTTGPPLARTISLYLYAVLF